MSHIRIKYQFMEPALLPRDQYPDEVRIINIDDREIIVIGTAHISKESVDLVRDVIQAEMPDAVCVELDERRFQALQDENKWEDLDIKTIIKQKQLSTLLLNLMLGSYQKRLGEKLGVTPGSELLEATKVAQAADIPISLCDRDVRITLRRSWNSMSFWEKLKFLTSGLAGVFDDQEISEEELRKMRQSDTLTDLMKEMGNAMPTLKRVLIDERDHYLAEKIRRTKGKKLVAVVGAGHLNGICDTIENHNDVDIEAIEVIPKSGSAGKVIGWGIPALIIGAVAYIGISQGANAAGDNALYWILANGIPSALGVLVALGHPLTILVTFFAAPLTSLTPLIGAGYVAAFVQAWIVPPVVREFKNVSADAGSVKMWWKNRLLRIMLVFVLASLGSILGTFVGAAEIISNLG